MRSVDMPVASQLLQYGPRGVGAPVVDEDHLVFPALERSGNLARQRRDVFCLIADRNDDGQFDTQSIGQP